MALFAASDSEDPRAMMPIQEAAAYGHVKIQLAAPRRGAPRKGGSKARSTPSPQVVARRRGEGQDAIAAREKATYKRCDANLERGRVVPAEEAVLRRGIGDRTNDRSVSGGSASPSTERWPAAIRSLSRAMRDPNTSVPLVLPVECARRISSGAACL